MEEEEYVGLEEGVDVLEHCLGEGEVAKTRFAAQLDMEILELA